MMPLTPETLFLRYHLKDNLKRQALLVLPTLGKEEVPERAGACRCDVSYFARLSAGVVPWKGAPSAQVTHPKLSSSQGTEALPLPPSPPTHLLLHET